MSIQKIDIGPRMSQAVVHQNVVYFSGQVGHPESDVATQTRETLAKIETLLAAAGSDKTQLLSATIWLRDMADFAAMNEVWDEWVGSINPPARACVQGALALDTLLVEIMVTAAVTPA